MSPYRKVAWLPGVCAGDQWWVRGVPLSGLDVLVTQKLELLVLQLKLMVLGEPH